MNEKLTNADILAIAKGWDVNPARSLSLASSAYLDPIWLEAEQEQIFRKSWQFLCHEEKLREQGSYVSTCVQEQSIVATRDREGTLRLKHRSRMNEYVSVTVWKHSDPIDWADMQAMLTENMEDQDAQKVTTVRWFEIDENTHGSVLTYPSKEAFENHRARIEAYRKESSEDLGITLEHKHDGVIRAEGSN